jgi:hypothetical protein
MPVLRKANECIYYQKVANTLLIGAQKLRRLQTKMYETNASVSILGCRTSFEIYLISALAKPITVAIMDKMMLGTRRDVL